MTVKERIEKTRNLILENWEKNHQFLGINKRNLLDCADGLETMERFYIIKKAIASLKLKKEHKRYFINPQKLGGRNEKA